MAKKVYCDLSLCLGCKSCELACAVEHSKSKELLNAIAEKSKKRVSVQASIHMPAPIRCQHCEVAACVLACMSGAMRKDEKTGKTIHDEDKCVGCWMCVMACPFGAITPEFQNKIVLKCDLCPDRDTPACVEACPTRALFIGSFEEFEDKVAKKSKVGK